MPKIQGSSCVGCMRACRTLSLSTTAIVAGRFRHHSSAGFENFDTQNEFEQLLINFTNESLQDTFNKQVFNNELRLYEEEGIDVIVSTCPDNAECLKLLSSKPDGIIPRCALQGDSWEAGRECAGAKVALNASVLCANSGTSALSTSHGTKIRLELDRPAPLSFLTWRSLLQPPNVIPPIFYVLS